MMLTTGREQTWTNRQLISTSCLNRIYQIKDNIMYRQKLEQIGTGNRVRIIAQYQHKAYGRLLILNVRQLEDYLSHGSDTELDPDLIFTKEWGLKPAPDIELLTDHVHLDISECSDSSFYRSVRSGDILICTCEIYKYQYNGYSYGRYQSGSDINFALKNPCDIEILNPVSYNDILYFIPKKKERDNHYWRYTGPGTKACFTSEYWNFTQTDTLPKRMEYKDFFDRDAVRDGYEVISEDQHSLELWYREKSQKLRVYKSVNDYFRSLDSCDEDDHIPPAGQMTG